MLTTVLWAIGVVLVGLIGWQEGRNHERRKRVAPRGENGRPLVELDYIPATEQNMPIPIVFFPDSATVADTAFVELWLEEFRRHSFISLDRASTKLMSREPS